MSFDCIVVGGGPAGLSAALMLGRCRRRVVLIDAGEPRNARSRAINGFLTRDGIPPAEFLRAAREQLTAYPTVLARDGRVVNAARNPGGFMVELADGARFRSRKLLLATGVEDEIPDIPGLAPLYGTSVHHCPFCDAWEWSDSPLAVYGCGTEGAGLALGLSVWSDDIVLCTDGPAAISDGLAEDLAHAGIRVREETVARFEGSDGRLEQVVFTRGMPENRRALFLAMGQHQRSRLAARLGCRFTEKGAVDTGKCEATNVPGLYVAGDASREAQFVVVAAAEGAEAGMAISQALLRDDVARRRAGRSLPAARGP